MSGDEGVVKFRVTHTQGELPPCEGLDELMRLRDELHALGLIGVNAQGIGYGNVSLRIACPPVPEESFIISGTATGGFAHLGQNGYCLVTGCDVSMNSVRSLGPVAASSESMTHHAVYAARPDVRCVLHVHSRRLFDALRASGCPATPGDVRYGTPAMARAVRDTAADMPLGLVVMTGHDEGILAFGPDCASARACLLAAWGDVRNIRT